MKNKIKYLVIVVFLTAGLFIVQASLSNDKAPVKNDDIKLDEKEKEIIDNEGKSGKDKDTVKGKIDKSKLTEEELKEYESYDPLGNNAKDQETDGKQ